MTSHAQSQSQCSLDHWSYQTHNDVFYLVTLGLAQDFDGDSFVTIVWPTWLVILAECGLEPLDYTHLCMAEGRFKSYFWTFASWLAKQTHLSCWLRYRQSLA